MKKFFIISSLALFAVACSSEEVKTTTASSTEKPVELAVEPNQILSLEIDGMVCKMGCGGSIRKELKGTGGVSRVEFDFDEERTTDFAKVYFNDEKVTKEEIIDLISELNEKQFTVNESSVEDFEEVSTDETDSESSSDEVSVDAYSDYVEVPNLLELIAEYILKVFQSIF